MSIKNIYQLWISEKDEVHFHELGSVLMEDDDTHYTEEKHSHLLEGMEVSKIFITANKDFNVEEMKVRLSNIPILSKWDISTVEDIVHENYMGKLDYCIRIEKLQ